MGVGLLNIGIIQIHPYDVVFFRFLVTQSHHSKRSDAPIDTMRLAKIFDLDFVLKVGKNLAFFGVFFPIGAHFFAHRKIAIGTLETSLR